MVLTGCSASGTQLELAPTADRRAAVGTTSAITDQQWGSRHAARRGNLRLPAHRLSAQLQHLAHRRHNAEVAAMMKATLRAFIGPTARRRSTPIHQHRADQDRPCGGHLHHQSRGGVSDGTSITWRDIASQIHAISADKAFEIASSICRAWSATRGSTPAGRGDVRQAVRGVARYSSRATACCCRPV